ncbi:probable E3 ubiquitin-protein ligase HERC4 isoform X2 [Haliotis rufescens]|uniref:probable E3 ubiquitin-protein ligase HERC4 isoform X2 n=1 Tax=Haliotis rufescens TaxID=6454 RepID=UPI001EB009F5|nr:probable E3 ubiquitin-protein ligase HERC4 isoform X2 [Haliotis rufescens]XP_046382188.1 probable E3 ubiquitin-protein ligase HERC4 isoform X2 [Haliotis rufescens]
MATVYCWGKANAGQLGLGPIDHASVDSPKQLHSLQAKDICDVCCGGNHTIVGFTDGTAHSCGDNDYGQLGHEKSRMKLEQIDTLRSQHVIRVKAGSSHSMVLTSAHEVFTMGDNSQGQLGRGKIADELTRMPKLVKSLAVHSVVQISCGNNHCLVLTAEGLVGAWGANNYGQLGLGNNTVHRDTPEFLTCLKGIPIAQIVAGGNHSFVLSKSGTMFGWGRNSFGQLGLNDERDRPFPTLCKSLRYQKIKFVSCGEDHTAALTQDGGVFTFGAGSYGQLGHMSTNNEILPKKVMELMGTEISQIVCGRRHTLAIAVLSGRLYSFGLGGNGQLGLGSHDNRTSPCVVRGLVEAPQGTSYSVQNNQASVIIHILRIFAGSDHCFVIVTSEEGCRPADYRNIDPDTQILTLSPQRTQEIAQLKSDEMPSIDLSEDVTKIFSHASCLNGSFLVDQDRHFGSSSRNPGVDMPNVRHHLHQLGQTSNVIIIQRITNSIEQDLLPSLPASPPDVEALRVFLILPECHLFDQPKYYSSLICPFGKNILNLDRVASKVLDLWWSALQETYFHRIVSVYKQCVQYILQLPDTTNPHESEKRGKGLYVSLEILKKLNVVNEQNGQIIPYHKFYVGELKDKINIKADYVSWVQQNSRLRQQGLHFCNYPFLFDAAAKSMLLQTDAMMQMQTAIDEVAQRNFSSLFLPIDPVNPCLVLFVTRENLVQDTLQQLIKYTSADLKKPLKILFMGEEAIDAGGLKKEFFLLLLREVLDPKYGMFRYHEESHMQWFNPQTFEDNSMFHLIGILCGLAIYNFTIIDLHFPQALYKKLLKRVPTIDDMKQLLPTVGRSLQHLLEHEGNDVEEIFGLTFEITLEVFGEVKTLELCDNGSKKCVNQDNRKEYVDLYIDFLFNKSVESQFEAFSSGFLKVCGGNVLELFHPQELQAMVVGNENYDFMELEKNTEYKGEYHRYHPTIKIFWEVFHEMEMEDKKKFLLFLTGSDRIPIFGMKYVKMVIQPTGGGDDYLPAAHTCFNLLDLPKYTRKDVLRTKLLTAIQQTEGFGLV